MAGAAESFAAPFISGKDSFYNSFETPDGRTVSVPMTLVMSALGIVEDVSDVLGTAVVSPSAKICLLGRTRPELLGTAYAEVTDLQSGTVPDVDPNRALQHYQRFYEAVRSGLVTSAHDVSEGGLGVCLAEMGFGDRVGMNVSLERVPVEHEISSTEILYSESGGRIVFTVDEDDVEQIQSIMADESFAVIGEATKDHHRLKIEDNDLIVDEPLKELKHSWTTGLEQSY
jgi:phosphoribosylformylglycinamidine (FGAM) synthase-like enzyme